MTGNRREIGVSEYNTSGSPAYCRHLSTGRHHEVDPSNPLGVVAVVDGDEGATNMCYVYGSEKCVFQKT